MSGKEAGLSGRTGIKICGLSRTCDIDHVNEAMPDYAGFILHFPKSHRNVTAQQARELIQRLKPGIRAVGVFVDVRERTGLPVWKAFRVRKAEDIGEAAACAADMVLLDNGYGTGEAFDWSIVSGAQALLQREFILAGGLTPDTIPEAVRALRPAAVDLSSGVETDKLKDRGKIIAAVRAVRNCAN